MSDKLRILITGFGPFPGAPFNPTQPLVARLLRLRRPALSDVELNGHIFPVTYKAVDYELPQLLAKHRPQALLMFGLATRTPYVRIETRARNAADSTGVDTRASRDAGSYLCNYLSWRAIEAVKTDGGPRLAAFVHVPLLKRDGASQRKGAAHRVTLEQLVDGGEAMLLEMVRLTQRAAREAREAV
jgi:pyroglutamyl-peptidase